MLTKADLEKLSQNIRESLIDNWCEFLVHKSEYDMYMSKTMRKLEEDADKLTENIKLSILQIESLKSLTTQDLNEYIIKCESTRDVIFEDIKSGEDEVDDSIIILFVSAQICMFASKIICDYFLRKYVRHEDIDMNLFVSDEIDSIEFAVDLGEGIEKLKEEIAEKIEEVENQ